MYWLTRSAIGEEGGEIMGSSSIGNPTQGPVARTDTAPRNFSPLRFQVSCFPVTAGSMYRSIVFSTFSSSVVSSELFMYAFTSSAMGEDGGEENGSRCSSSKSDRGPVPLTATAISYLSALRCMLAEKDALTKGLSCSFTLARFPSPFPPTGVDICLKK